MAKWLKLCAICTFSTQPDSHHYTTLLKADVPNFYLTLDFLQSDCFRFGVKVKKAYCCDNFLA